MHSGNCGILLWANYLRYMSWVVVFSKVLGASCRSSEGTYKVYWEFGWVVSVVGTQVRVS